MRKLLVGLLITGSLSLAVTPQTAVAGSGEVAAGVVGGLAVGTLFGAAIASGPRYYQPAPVYVAPGPCTWRRTATGPEAHPFGMGIEAFAIDRASRFAPEHPGLRLKFKPRVKSPAPAGLFFTFRRRRTLCLQSTAPALVEV